MHGTLISFRISHKRNRSVYCWIGVFVGGTRVWGFLICQLLSSLMSLSLTFLKSESPVVFGSFYIIFQVALQVAVRGAFRGRAPTTVVFHLVEEEVSHQAHGLVNVWRCYTTTGVQCSRGAEWVGTGCNIRDSCTQWRTILLQVPTAPFETN